MGKIKELSLLTTRREKIVSTSKLEKINNSTVEFQASNLLENYYSGWTIQYNNTFYEQEL